MIEKVGNEEGECKPYTDQSRASGQTADDAVDEIETPVFRGKVEGEIKREHDPESDDGIDCVVVALLDVTGTYGKKKCGEEAGPLSTDGGA